MADTDNTPQETPEGGSETELTAEEKAVAAAEATKEAEVSEKGDKKTPDKKDEEVKYDLALPDGSLLDPSKLDEISAFAKENGLSAEEAQAVVERESKMAGDAQASNDKVIPALTKEWKDDAKADKEIGGDNLTKSVELSSRVQERFGSEALGKMLEDTGFIHHPEWIRFTSRIGAIMSDDQFILAKTKDGEDEQSYADKFYGKTTKKAAS
ncbi:MAG: hypothetical protein KAR06_06950 [Deltaproteobacteria bacterium]|nr:hypothetical protein [Deltaproteobacteria bacterium]